MVILQLHNTMTSTPSTLRPGLPNSLSFRGKNVVMASHGRAPWYTPDGTVINAYVIGIAGGSSSGKVCWSLAELTADVCSACYLSSIEQHPHCAHLVARCILQGAH